MQVDYISDLHLDFHIKLDHNTLKWNSTTEEFLSKLLPDKQGEILIIAGDISHYNIQSKWCLDYFSTVYDKVFYVMGNHDYYLISGNQEDKYKHNSKEREFELVSMMSGNTKVVFLNNFEVFDYKGVLLAGSTFWYPLDTVEQRTFFNGVSNDSQLIKKMDIGFLNYQQTNRYNELPQVDIVVTHVSPIVINSHRKYDSIHCYLNQIEDIKADHYVFGHCHETNIYEKAGSNFYINALGYPNENKGVKIKSFEV